MSADRRRPAKPRLTPVSADLLIALLISLFVTGSLLTRAVGASPPHRLLAAAVPTVAPTPTSTPEPLTPAVTGLSPRGTIWLWSRQAATFCWHAAPTTVAFDLYIYAGKHQLYRRIEARGKRSAARAVCAVERLNPGGYLWRIRASMMGRRDRWTSTVGLWLRIKHQVRKRVRRRVAVPTYHPPPQPAAPVVRAAPTAVPRRVVRAAPTAVRVYSPPPVTSPPAPRPAPAPTQQPAPPPVQAPPPTAVPTAVVQSCPTPPNCP